MTVTSFQILQCTYIFSVVHFEDEIFYEYDESERSLLGYTSCLHINNMVVGKHIKEAAPTDLQVDTAIPFTINIIEKVFLTLAKAEKDQSDQDEEDEFY